MTMIQILSAKSGIVAHSDLRRFLRQRAQQRVACFEVASSFCRASYPVNAPQEECPRSLRARLGHLMSGDPGARRIRGRKKAGQLRPLAQNQI